MPTHGFFVTVQTLHPFDQVGFAEPAGQLADALQSTLGDLSCLRKLTHYPTLCDARVEVEIAQAEPEHYKLSPIVARALVKATTANDKMRFDKPAFSKMIRDRLPFAVKVQKQAVAQEELAS